MNDHDEYRLFFQGEKSKMDKNMAELDVAANTPFRLSPDIFGELNRLAKEINIVADNLMARAKKSLKNK